MTVNCQSSPPPSVAPDTAAADFAVAPAIRRGALPAAVSRVPLDPAPAFLGHLAARRTKVDDPVYHRPKEYEGYVLGDVLAAAGLSAATLERDLQIVLICADGYRPSVGLETAVRERPILAFRDLGAPDGQTWDPLRQGRDMITPAPFYLVWSGPGSSDGASRPWPYRVVALELWRRDEAFPDAGTGAGAAVEAGGDLFRRDCLSCHSLNQTGGTVGPELNVPANVTEYWRPEALRRFIRNPAALRSGSRMPSIAHLTDDDIAHLTAYLAYMRTRKVAAVDDRTR